MPMLNQFALRGNLVLESVRGIQVIPSLALAPSLSAARRSLAEAVRGIRRGGGRPVKREACLVGYRADWGDTAARRSIEYWLERV